MSVGTPFRLEAFAAKIPEDGAVAVLDGVKSSFSTAAVVAAWSRHRNGDFQRAVAAVTEAISGQAWRWRWLDNCLDVFRENKRWPDIPAWSVFEPCMEPMPRTRAAALEWLSLKEVRAILKAQGVAPDGTKKSDAYDALCRKVPYEKWRDLARANWDAEVNAPADGDAEEGARVKLLVLAMSHASFAAQRYAQLLGRASAPSREQLVRIEFADKLAQGLSTQAGLGSPIPGLPPFYPGDTSDVQVQVLGKWPAIR